MIFIITGIIAEYNPFHKGHQYHLHRAIKDTRCCYIVCVISGNFMQRGIPALTDKWKRAEMALKDNADLVLELPAVYSVSSAEHFAFGAVSLLDSLGIIDNVYFGSEEGNIDVLRNIAKVLAFENDDFKKILKSHLDKGCSFASAREISLSEYLGLENAGNILSNSNNILGIEYIKSLIRLKSSIKPFTLKREGSSYNDTELSKAFASATAIREHLKNGTIDEIKNFLPLSTYEILKKLSSEGYNFTYSEKTFSYIKYKLLCNIHKLHFLPDVSEGIDNKIYKEILTSNSLDELILKVKSKRYTYTRISRILMQYFLGFENYDVLSLVKAPAPYARILGFNAKGRKLLKEIKKTSQIPLITKVPQKNLCPHMEIDINATKCYSILNPSVPPAADYTKGPVIML